VIAGETHPEVARQKGESYRHSLRRLARRLGVADRVLLVDAFLTEEELSAILARAEVFLTPYRSPEQICSGALTFALVAGRPIVSTAYRYAVEMLAPDANGNAPGVVVPCGDAPAIADALAGLLADQKALMRAADAARRLGTSLTWPAMARRFAEVFSAAARGPHQPATAGGPHRPATVAPAMPLTHLRRLVDEIGIIQFSEGSRPVPESGRCVDDMARLGIVASGLLDEANDDTVLRWLAVAIGFMDAAVTRDGMHNLMDGDGRWHDAPHVGDHVGRTIWAAATVAAGGKIPQPLKIRADRVLCRTAHLLEGVGSPRTLAYGLLGLTARAPGSAPPHLDRVLRLCAARLVNAREPDARWPWFEPVLAYDNARMPQALLAAGVRLRDTDMISRALTTLDWYLGQIGLTGREPMLRLVGNQWRTVTGTGDHEGDEQPIDAAAAVEALAFAWQRTRNPRYATLAQRAFAWFHGANRAGVALYDPSDGGCADGLSANGVSLNRGAESTLAYYQALLALHRAGLGGDAIASEVSPPAIHRLSVFAASVHAGPRLSRWSSTSGSDAQATPMAKSAVP
jgi:glycosyl transferase family 1